jgi:hypothetical protein
MTVVFTISPNSLNRAGYILNIGPPLFMDELEEIILLPNNSKRDFELPLINDPDDDLYELTFNLNNAFPFTKIINDHQHLQFDYSKAT